MKENMMNKLLILPMFFLTMCGTAPVTPPAQACSPRLDGEPTNCPPPDVVCLSLNCLPSDVGPIFPKPIVKPKPEIRGEIDIYNPTHWHQMQIMFERNARRNEVEKNMTQPDDAINRALMEFYNGSNGSTESQELLQLPSDGNKPSS